MTPPKAYSNPHFLLGEEAREVRILCEYLEPRTRLRQAGVHRAIAFFGSARIAPGSDPDYYAQAQALTERLARWTMEAHPSGSRFHFCCGGGPGLMEAVSKGVAQVNRRLNVGLNISLPREQAANPWLEDDLTFDFHYFFMRKFWFANLAQAVVAMPGGFGTLDELFEMLTLIQTRKMAPRPIVLMGREYWQKMVDWDGLAARGLISSADLKLFVYIDEADAVFDYLTTHLDDAVEAPVLRPESERG